MKNLLSILVPCAALHSCVTLTGELNIPGDGRPGSLGGKISGAVSWPPPAPPSGKEPVGKEPVPRAPTQAELDYFRALFAQPAQPAP